MPLFESRNAAFVARSGIAGPCKSVEGAPGVTDEYMRPVAPPSRRVESVGLVGLLLAFWIIAHPWGGLVHDGILYAAQAMLHVRPEVFRGDLFFAWGSQDDYTMFGRAYAVAVDMLGLKSASRTLWAVAQFLGFAVTLAWLGRVVPRDRLLLVAAVFFALPGYYSSDAALRLAEPFLTARSFAEPLTLAGVLAYVLRRRFFGALLLLLAAAVHPIMALPGILCVSLLAASARWKPDASILRRRSFLAFCFLAILLGALLIGTGKVARIDQGWYELVVLSSPIIDPLTWQSADWVRVAVPLAVLALMARYSADRWSEVWQAASICGLLGIAIAVFASLTRWELGVQAQLWRLAWLSIWAAPLAVLSTACGPRADDEATRLVLLAAIPALVLASLGRWHAGLMLPVVYVLFLALFLSGRVTGTRVSVRIAAALALVQSAFALAGGALIVYVLLAYADERIVENVSMWFLLTEQFGWIALPVLAVCAQRTFSVIGLRYSVAVSLLACAVAVLASVNGRSPSGAAYDNLLTSGIPEWAAVIPSESTVFWPDHVTHVWFVLGRRSYVSVAQACGGVFGREVTLEAQRRAENVATIGGPDAVLRFRDRGFHAIHGALVRADLERACADPALGFVVLPQKFEPTVAPPYRDPRTSRVYHLHRCTDFRAH